RRQPELAGHSSGEVAGTDRRGGPRSWRTSGALARRRRPGGAAPGVPRAAAAAGVWPVRRVCLVGTPNKGTSLAQYSNLVRFLDGHLSMLARVPANVAQAPLEGTLCMLRFVALDVASALPGIEALQPESATRRDSGVLLDCAQE